MKKRAAELLYDVGLRGDAITDMLRLVVHETGWNPTGLNPHGELSVGLWQINLRMEDLHEEDQEYRVGNPTERWGGLGFADLEEAKDALTTLNDEHEQRFWDTTERAIALVISEQLYRGKKNPFEGPWANAWRKSREEYIKDNSKSYWENFVNKILPLDWATSDLKYDEFRYQNFDRPDNLGRAKAEIGLVQKFFVDRGDDIVIDALTGPITNQAIRDYQEANGLKVVDGAIRPELIDAITNDNALRIADTGYDSDPYTSGRSYQTDQARNLPKPISSRGEYDLDQDAYVNPADDPALVGTIASFQDADAAGLDATEEPPPITGGNPPGFDPWPFVDAPPNYRRPGGVEGDFGGQAGALGFLRGRADARVFDPKTGQEYDFVEFMETQLRGETDPDRIALWIDTWLPKTTWFQNTPATVRGRISQWYSEGMGVEEEEWTGARRGRVQPYYDTLLDLIQREGFEAEEAAIWDTAKLGYLYDWDEDKFIRYFSGETVDGESNVEGDVFFEGPTSAAGNIANIKSTMRTSANTYLISMNPTEERALAKRIFTGEVPIANVDNIFREKARLLYPYLADFYDAGGTTTEFLNQYDPIMQRMLGRSAEWSGRDYSMGQAALTGDLTDLHYYMWRGGNTMTEVQMGDPGTPGRYVPRDPFGRPNQVTPKAMQPPFGYGPQIDQTPKVVDRPLTVQEFKLAIKRSGEYQQSGYALAEMGQLLNLLGSGMGAAP
jgi:peptidoglycan hydrolase-like protein with peptidoglycan-binding domain